MQTYKEAQTKFIQLFDALERIEYLGDNLQLEFTYLSIKELIAECWNLFISDCIQIDGQVFGQHNQLPLRGAILQFGTTTSKLMKNKIIISETKEILSDIIISKFSGNCAEVSDYLFVVNDRCYTYENIETFISNTITCLRVYEHLQNFADYTFEGPMIFLDTSLLDMPRSFQRSYVVSLRHADRFLKLDVEKEKPECKIFISTLVGILKEENYDDRLRLFFLKFDSIMQNYFIALSNHYEKFNLHHLKTDLDNTWINLNDKIHRSLANIKGEILILISAAIAITQFDFSWSGTLGKNIAILFILPIVSLLYSYLVWCDKKSLKRFNLILTEEKDRLEKIIVDISENNQKIDMIKKDMEDLSSTIFLHRIFLIFSSIIVWLPLIVILGIIIF